MCFVSKFIVPWGDGDREDLHALHVNIATGGPDARRLVFAPAVLISAARRSRVRGISVRAQPMQSY